MIILYKYVSASPPGVLGGFGAVTPVDVKESNAFLDKVLDLRPSLKPLQRVAGKSIFSGNFPTMCMMKMCYFCYVCTFPFAVI
jgi:hypothetical protein